MTSFKKAKSFLATAFLSAAFIAVPAAANDAPEPDSKTTQTDPVENLLRDILPILKMVNEKHLNGLKSPEETKADILNSVLKGLDPHSRYYTKKQYEEFQEEISGEFAGLGIEIAQEGDFIKIVAPIENTPASRAGILPNDLITHIDNESAVAMDPDKAANKMRGKPGTKVTLKIKRDGHEEPIDITLEREIIKRVPVKFARIGNDIGYVRLSNFIHLKTDENKNPIIDYRGQPEESGSTLVRDALLQLREEMGPDAKGYILDLRNNPGGFVRQAIEIADHFLEAGKTVYTVHGRDSKNLGAEETSILGDLLHGKRLIVLVNGGSASASEIVAGALQDHERADILGELTFGKATMQNIIEDDDGTAIKYTMAKYHTPNGREIQGKGIEPNILYIPLEEKKETQRREADLPNTIGNTFNDQAESRTRATCKLAAEKTPAQKLPEILIDKKDGKIDGMLLCAVETLRNQENLTQSAPVLKERSEAVEISRIPH